MQTVYYEEICISWRSGDNDDGGNEPLREESSKGCIEGLVTGEERRKW
jgi:hypothetical protein